MARRLGYLPDELDTRDLAADELLAARGFPKEASLDQWLPIVRDQGRTNSCVAQALAAAIDIRELRAGLPDDPVSRLFLYWNSRAQHGAQRRDRGTYIRSACKALQNLGAPPEDLFPFRTNPISVARMPPFGAYRGAFKRKVTGAGYYRLVETGEPRLDAIRSAIAGGFPVVFGTGVSGEFLRSSGTANIHPPSAVDVIGGHAMVVVGYQDGSNGLRFRVLNSWGFGWRDGGLAWLTAEYMAWNQTRDLWIIEGWPQLALAETP